MRERASFRPPVDFWDLVIVVAAGTIACVSARPYAGGWNDGSRLAMVEALVDYHTLAIDHSIFVQVPNDSAALPAPYPPSITASRIGTQDKLLIDGHFYSDKSPVPGLLLAGVYQSWQWCTGKTARTHTDQFCYLMTLASSGLAYVVAVWCIYRLGRFLRLPLRLRLLLPASFAMTTLALPYTRHANNHVVLLAAAAFLMLHFSHLPEETPAGRPFWGRWLCMGAAAGFGYTIDLGAGPVLFLCTLLLALYRRPSVLSTAVFLAAAAPWLVLHQVVNYAVGGTFGPANAVAAYFQWPGCPFTPENLTGGWKHPNITHFLLYAADLLFGRRGFLGHDFALFLAAPAAALLLQRRVREWPEVLAAVCFCGGTWFAYAVNSNNASGQCCSIRWFLPLLAPGYYLLALLLHYESRYGTDLLILSAWGSGLMALAWREGPWMDHMIPGFWFFQAGALLSWLSYYIWLRWNRTTPKTELPAPNETKAA